MWFDLWLNRKAASRQRQARRVRARCPGQWLPGSLLSLERLEDRSLPSAGPVPIPGGVLDPNPFGGPDIHIHLPGPVDSATPNKIGGDPSSIYDFNGFIGAARVEGTGTDNSGNTLTWDVDLRFMKGVFQASDGSIQEGTFAFV